MNTKSSLATLIRCFYFFLTAAVSNEDQLMMKSTYFQAVSWPNGTNVCAVDREVETYSTASVVSCSDACKNSPNCGNFNYDRRTKSCSVFASRPTCYGFVSHSCYHYELTSYPEKADTGIVAEECYIPFTFGKKLYYECESNLTGEGCLNCLVHNRTIVNCQQPSYYHATLTLANITVPTFSTSVPLMTVNRWIVVSNRIYNSVSFNRTWVEYRSGFGDPSLDYWIGLEQMHQLTNSGSYRLRFELMSVENGSWFSAEYDSIRIDPESNWYAIHLDGYSGDAGDAMNRNPPSIAWQNHKNFSTYDSDNDQSVPSSCSQEHGGAGWWFASCGVCDLNSEFGSATYYWKPIVLLGLGTVPLLNGSRIMFKLA